jgi:hypothetical protein
MVILSRQLVSVISLGGEKMMEQNKNIGVGGEGLSTQTRFGKTQQNGK